MGRLSKVLGNICKRDREEYLLKTYANDSIKNRIDRYLDKRYGRKIHKYLASRFGNSEYINEERKLIVNFCYEAARSDNRWMINHVLLDKRVCGWFYEKRIFNELLCNIVGKNLKYAFVEVLEHYNEEYELELVTQKITKEGLSGYYFDKKDYVTNVLQELVLNEDKWGLEYFYSSGLYKEFLVEDLEFIFWNYVESRYRKDSKKLLWMISNTDIFKKIGINCKREFVKSLIKKEEEESILKVGEGITTDEDLQKIYLEELEVEKIKDIKLKIIVENLKLERRLREDLVVGSGILKKEKVVKV